MMGMNYNPTKEDIDSWMAMTDLDGDGKVNLEDYERLIIASLEKCGIKIYEREWFLPICYDNPTRLALNSPYSYFKKLSEL